MTAWRTGEGREREIMEGQGDVNTGCGKSITIGVEIMQFKNPI